MPTATALVRFHPLVAEWFPAAIGEPTPVQELVWPRLAAGAHVLATAPTGSGKTLAAFLWALDRLITGAWPPGRISVVYVSPRKALDDDLRRTLLDPLARLAEAFAARGERMPGIRVQVPGGESPDERPRWSRRPPEILVTTPEDLDLLLTRRDGRRALGEARMLILDEVHAVAASKRGARLMAAVERLRLLAGEFQRIALSASVRQLEVAAFVGGQLADGRPRTVEILRAPGGKRDFPRARATCGRDLLESAVLGPLAEGLAGEALAPIENPLDVLARLLVSMCAVETWEVDRLYAFVRTVRAWRDLPREAFDSVVAMLLGAYDDGRIRALGPRLRLRRRVGSRDALSARESARHLAWEPGDDRNGPSTPPWASDGLDGVGERGWSLSRRIGEFLERAEAGRDDPAFAAGLRERHLLEPEAAEELLRWLDAQRQATGALPHRHLLIAERCPDPTRPEAERLMLHAPWGGRVLRPWAMALTQAWRQRFGAPPELVAGDDCLLLRVPKGLPAREVLALVPPERLDHLLRAQLPGTGFFAARFRENATRAQLLPRAGLHERASPWSTRRRARQLLEAVAGHTGFPILVETWRTCLQDSFDLPALHELLAEVVDGVIELREVATERPSPFAEEVATSATSRQRNAEDRSEHRPAASTGERGPVTAPRPLEPRPSLSRALVDELQAKLLRTFPGYAPTSADELIDLLDERVLMPLDEFRALLAAATRDHGAQPEALIAGLGGRAVRLARPAAVVATSRLSRLLRALDSDLKATGAAGLGGEPVLTADDPDAEPDEALEHCLAGFLRSHGPLDPGWLALAWALPRARVDAAIDRLIEDELAVGGVLVEGDARALVCDAAILERLRRLTRVDRRLRPEPLPLAALPLFIADWQGLVRRGSDIESLQASLEKLSGAAAPTGLWESAILPARVHPYLASWLDRLMQTSDFMWFGAGRERIGFCYREALPLFVAVDPPVEGDAVSALLPDPESGYDFFSAQKQSGLTSTELAGQLWEQAWRGRVANDSFAAVRQGNTHGFKAMPLTGAPTGRAELRGWRKSRPLQGTWHRLRADPPDDALAEHGRDQERVRQLIERHGVIFRELLDNEVAPLGWERLLPAMRSLELGGELISGSFFAGVPGLQFASPSAVRRLGEPLPEDAVWWLDAADPASCCGLKLEGLKRLLPPRHANIQLVFRGRALALVLRRAGRGIEFGVPPRDPALPLLLAPLREWLSRQVAPQNVLAIEAVNGESALESAYAPALLAAGFHREQRALVLRRE